MSSYPETLFAWNQMGSSASLQSVFDRSLAGAIREVDGLTDDQAVDPNALERIVEKFDTEDVVLSSGADTALPIEPQSKNGTQWVIAKVNFPVTAGAHSLLSRVASVPPERQYQGQLQDNVVTISQRFELSNTADEIKDWREAVRKGFPALVDQYNAAIAQFRLRLREELAAKLAERRRKVDRFAALQHELGEA